jgi:hypothetical protein
VGFSGRAVVSSSQIQVATAQIPFTNLTIAFENESDTSETFSVYSCEIENFDRLNLKLFIQADLSRLSALQLNWSHANPSGFLQLRMASMAISGLFVYITLLFCFLLKFDSEIFTQIFCIGLGVLGALTSNPIGCSRRSDFQFAADDTFLLALYTAAFRGFCVAQFDIVRTFGIRPNLFLVALAAVLGFCDAIAPNIYFLAAYSTLATVLVGAAALTNSDRRRLTVFAVLAAVDVGGRCLAGQMAAAFPMSVIPDALRRAAPLHAGAFAIFVMHCDRPRRYSPVTDWEEGIELSADALSSGDAEEEGFYQDEEESEY